jgi:hypothetical protein
MLEYALQCDRKGIPYPSVMLITCIDQLEEPGRVLRKIEERFWAKVGEMLVNDSPSSETIQEYNYSFEKTSK